MEGGLLVLLVLVGGGAGQEPSGGYCIGTGCFSLFRAPADFRTAQRLCRARGGHLMTVRSSVSNDVLSVLLGGLTGGFWIGLRRQGGCPEPAGGLRGFQWVTEDSESDFSNFVPTFNSSCAAHGCVSVRAEDGWRWRQSACARPAAGFLCEHSFTEPCQAVPAEPDRPVLYMTPFGFGLEDVHAVPPGSTATRAPPGTKLLCLSGRWVRAPWSCDIQQGGCEHECAEGPGGGPVCSCPPGLIVDPDNRVSCATPSACAPGFKRRGERCVDVDECVSAPCEHECVNTHGGYTCTCYDGYRAEEHAPDRCALFCGGAECPATCDPNDPQQCFCPKGFILEERPGGRFCLEMDECAFDTCDHTCTNTHGSYVCSCRPGFKLLEQFRCVQSEEDPRGASTSSAPCSSSVPPPEPTRRPSAVTLRGLVGAIVCAVLLLVLLVFGVHVGLAHRERKRRRMKSSAETHDLQTVTGNRE